MKKTLTIALALCFANTFAQEDAISAFDIQTDLDATNEHFSGLASFRIDKKDRLVIELSDGGTVYRQDLAYFSDLQADLISFDANTNTVVLKCTAAEAKCVEKHVMKNGAISASGRSTIPVPGGDTEGREAIALLAKLVRDKQQALHDEAHVTPGAAHRKK